MCRYGQCCSTGASLGCCIKGRGTWNKMISFFHRILFPMPRNECTIFLRFFSERFHCQTGACKIDFSPVLLHPARRILLRSIWGMALRDAAKEWLQSARILCTWWGCPTIAAYIAWRADQVLYGSYPPRYLRQWRWFVCFLCKIVELKHEQRNTVSLFEH